MMTGTGDNASIHDLPSGDRAAGQQIVAASNIVIAGGGSTVQVSSVSRSPQAARQRQAVELWRMLRDHTPAGRPTPLDVLIAEATAGAVVLDSDTISQRLQQAAEAGQEQPPWREIVNQPSLRRTLMGVLRALSLLEHTDLGTPGARRLRDQPDDDLIAEILDTAQALQRPRSPLDLQQALIMAADIAGFGHPSRGDHDQVALRDAMYRILQQAIDHSIDAGWTEVHTEDRGDGVLMVFPQPPQTAELLGLIDQLSIQLRQHNRVRTAQAALRLRVAAHVGLVRADEHGVLGQAVNLTCRLLDAPVAKRAMRDSGADLTMMLSDRLYADSRSHTKLDQAGSTDLQVKFRSVAIDMKETKGRGWLLVDVDPQLPRAAAEPLTAPRSTQRVHATSPTSIIGGSTAPDMALTAMGTLVQERMIEDHCLNEDEIRLLAQIASGVTADAAARNLELSARTLRRRLRTICDRLGVNTPIEAVVWAARRQLI